MVRLLYCKIININTDTLGSSSGGMFVYSTQHFDLIYDFIFLFFASTQTDTKTRQLPRRRSNHTMHQLP